MKSSAPVPLSGSLGLPFVVEKLRLQIDGKGQSNESPQNKTSCGGVSTEIVFQSIP